jgi:hypothetical protein
MGLVSAFVMSDGLGRILGARGHGAGVEGTDITRKSGRVRISEGRGPAIAP